ncbi:MAG: SDR family oxidoreductase [Anaerolineae bacterium]|nr:SDR family oxidoreductase [Anaerolineae bacterium]
MQRGEQVIATDISLQRDRLNLILSAEQQEAIEFAALDITETQQVAQMIGDKGVTHIIHLAALQVPFCKAKPVLGAQVNVVGTINVFEAARQHNIGHVVYASSVAVYGPPERYPADTPIENDAPLDPHTLYGVYKQANEQAARVYHADYGLSSTALRPYIVYGVGRDQGLTSDPTKAMLAAIRGEPYHIGVRRAGPDAVCCGCGAPVYPGC